MNRPRPPARLAGLLLLLPLVASCAVAGRRCENVELQRAAAPGGTYDAVLYGRTCDEGAASTNVSLVFSGARVSEDIGNLFQAAGAPEDVSASIAWSGDRVLTIRHAAAARVLKQEPGLREMAVRYEPLPEQL